MSGLSLSLLLSLLLSLFFSFSPSLSFFVFFSEYIVFLCFLIIQNIHRLKVSPLSSFPLLSSSITHTGAPPAGQPPAPYPGYYPPPQGYPPPSGTPGAPPLASQVGSLSHTHSQTKRHSNVLTLMPHSPAMGIRSTPLGHRLTLPLLAATPLR